MWYILTMEHHCAVKRDAVWINMEESKNSMWSEGSHIVSYDSISLKCPEKAKLQRQEAELGVARLGWEQGVTARHKGSLWGDGNGLKLDRGDGCTAPYVN